MKNAALSGKPYAGNPLYKGLVWTFAVVACSLTVRAGLNVIPQPKEVVEEPGCFIAPADIFEKLPAGWIRDGTLPAEGYALSVTKSGVGEGLPREVTGARCFSWYNVCKERI